jgi:hypothetical protein
MIMDNTDKIVFHYTSLEGLLGITASASIWATNILYLNDASEFNYAKSLLSEELRRICDVNPDFNNKTNFKDFPGYFFFEILEENINKLLPSEHFSFYVCSFSEESDLLSQWRGYCANNSGYSIGFALSRLQKWLKQNGLVIKPCVYDKGKQIEAINMLLQKAADRFISEIGSSGDKETAWNIKSKLLAVDFMLEFIQIAPFLKHPKFAEEREWRIMANFETKNVISHIKFRSCKTIIAPYIDIPLPMDAERLIIEEIFIGPTNERQLSMAVVEMLLKSRNINCSKVNCSTIPYRAI